MSTIRGIKYVSLAGRTGYGVAASRYMRGLARAGMPLTWTPMVRRRGRGGYEPFTGSSIGDAALDPYCNRRLEYDAVIVHTVPEYFPLWRSIEPGKRIVGYTVWETTAIPAHWLDLLNGVDHLLVPCHWNKGVFERCGVATPIDVIPHIAELPAPYATGDDESGRDEYVFCTIGDWTNRKTVWNTVRAYCDAFASGDATALVLKTSRKDFSAALFNRFHRSTKSALRTLVSQYARPPKIRLVTDDLDADGIRRLHAQSDCYVSLCRAEGWGLGAFDAAAQGNPVVMTGFGGQLDYLRGDQAYLVDFTLVSVADQMARRSYSPDQMWAEPNVQEAATWLKAIVENPDAARVRGRAQQMRILDEYGERRVTERLIKTLEHTER